VDQYFEALFPGEMGKAPTPKDLKYKLPSQRWTKASQTLKNFRAKQSSLLAPLPDKRKVGEILDSLGLPDSHVSTVENAKLIFSKLLGTPGGAANIPDEHKEVRAFVKLASKSLVDKIHATFSKLHVDRYHTILFPEKTAFQKWQSAQRIQGLVRGWAARHRVRSMPPPSLFRASPDMDKVGKIVETMRASPDGSYSLRAISRLFGTLLHAEPENLKDHPEVLSLVGLQREELISTMCGTASEGDVAYWHGILYPGPPMTEKLASSTVIQAAVRGCRDRRATRTLQEMMDEQMTLLQASLLRAPPDKEKVTKLIQRLESGKSGKVSHSLVEVKRLFSRLLRIDAGHIPDDHAELQSCVGLTTDATVNRVCEIFSANDVDQYYLVIYPEKTPAEKHASAQKIQGGIRGVLSRMRVKRMRTTIALKKPPDPTKVGTLLRIVQALDVDKDGIISSGEAKELFALLLKLPPEEIPDDHEQILSCTGLAPAALIEKLCDIFTASDIDQYFQALYLHRTPGEKQDAACKLQAATRGFDARREVAMLREGSLLRRRPDREKVAAIVVKILDEIDFDGDKKVNALEAKHLFSYLLAMPVEDIPEDHPEILSYVGLKTDSLVLRIQRTLAAGDIDKCHDRLFAAPPSAGTVSLKHRQLTEAVLNDSIAVNGADRGLSGQLNGLFGKLLKRIKHYASAFEYPEAESIGEETELLSTAAVKLMCSKLRGADVEVGEVQALLAQLLDVPAEEIPFDHPEIEAFTSMSIEEIGERLCPEVSERERYGTMCEYWSKVEQIVAVLDTSIEGYREATLPEIKCILSKLLGIPEAEIPDDDEEVVALTGKSINEVREQLYARSPAPFGALSRSSSMGGRGYTSSMELSMSPPGGAGRWGMPPASSYVLPASSSPSESPPRAITNSRYHEKMDRIVECCDMGVDRPVSVDEVKTILSKLIGMSEGDIPEDHPELVALTGMGLYALVETLYAMSPSPSVISLSPGLPPSPAKDGHSPMAPIYHPAEARPLPLNGSFDRMDQNHDGVVTRDEYNAAVAPSMPRFDAVASVTREDIELRRKAAQIADIDEAGLPNVQDLKGVTHWLFGVLAREGDTEISAAKLIVACKLFDDRVPISAFDDTLAAVDARESLDRVKLMNWLVLMFGDCDPNEFLNSVVRFGEAAKSIRGLRFEVTAAAAPTNRCAVAAQRGVPAGSL